LTVHCRAKRLHRGRDATPLTQRFRRPGMKNSIRPPWSAVGHRSRGPAGCCQAGPESSVLSATTFERASADRRGKERRRSEPRNSTTPGPKRTATSDEKPRKRKLSRWSRHCSLAALRGPPAYRPRDSFRGSRSCRGPQHHSDSPSRPWCGRSHRNQSRDKHVLCRLSILVEVRRSCAVPRSGPLPWIKPERKQSVS